MELLKPGTYVLTRSVDNPCVDRRVTRDWRRVAQYAEGERFEVRDASGEIDGVPIPAIDYRPLSRGYCVPVAVFEGDDLNLATQRYEALAAALLPAGARVGEVMRAVYSNPEVALQALVDAGRVTLEECVELGLTPDE